MKTDLKFCHLKHLSLIGCIGCCVVPSVSAYSAPLQGYVMQVQLTPAVCAIDTGSQKQRKCLEGYSLTIMGLLPETTQTDCSISSSATLSPIQANLVTRIMPDEDARRQLWRRVGGCIPMNSSQYFRTIISFAERLKVPAELTSGVTREVNAAYLKQQFTRVNPKMTGSSLHFDCEGPKRNQVLSQINICYGVDGQYKKCTGAFTNRQCPETFVIQGGY